MKFDEMTVEELERRQAEIALQGMPVPPKRKRSPPPSLASALPPASMPRDV